MLARPRFLSGDSATGTGLVSVVIPAYMAAKYLPEAVESALEQPETGEVIVVEDGSIDGTLEVASHLENRHSKVRLVRHTAGINRGPGASRNLGIAHAKFEFLAFLDADDYFLPGRFGVAIELMNKRPDVDGVYEAVGTVFQNDSARHKWFLHQEFDLYTVHSQINPECMFEALIGGEHGNFHTTGLLVRKNIFRVAGLFNEFLPLSQDSEMWFRMALTSRLVPGRLSEPVSMRRVHGGNRCFVTLPMKRLMGIAVCGRLLAWAFHRRLLRARTRLIAHRYWAFSIGVARPEESPVAATLHAAAYVPGFEVSDTDGASIEYSRRNT